MANIQRAHDVARLKHTMTRFIGVPDATYDQEPIPLAFEHAGITTFNGHFVNLSTADIDSLTYLCPQAAAVIPLNIVNKRKLKMLLAFLHHQCLQAGSYQNIGGIDPALYDVHRVSVYNPNQDIVPWNAASNNTNVDEVAAWNKTVKPTRSDYKTFKDPANWTRYKESIVTTLDSHNLSHLIDSTHVPSNAKLDSLQQKWLYKTFQDCFLHANAKGIVTNHLTHKNTRHLRRDLCNHYDNSMTAQLRSQTLSSYLTATHLANLNWRGTQQNFILNWKEQA